MLAWTVPFREHEGDFCGDGPVGREAWKHTSACFSTRQHASAYVSIRQHTANMKATCAVM